MFRNVVIELLQKLKEGDKQAYEQLFCLYYAHLVAYAYSILQQKETAEDIVQELFIDFWCLKKYKHINGNIENYWYRSVRNNCLTYLRNQKCHEEHLLRLGKTAERTESFQFTLEELEEKEEIRKAIEHLPEQCRLVFKLCCFENMKYQEVADQLGISINTVRTQMGRALKSLRASLKGKTFNLILWNLFIHRHTTLSTFLTI